ncbi:protease SohB [Halomonas icarae]|uniref:Protease SohB n=1 Tax=Halomonas icarae TaxID=2691040 RepID=A0A7X4VXP8_9GAMM|nr:protease SohB [Halomonas icarae]MDR5902053.1 protease SohB [Halomonas icarae]NAW12247.1 protease SohB [Halomonas icarae]
MGEWLADVGLFLVQLLSVVLVVGLAVAVVARLRQEAGSDSRLKLVELNRGRDERKRRLRLAASEPGARKRLLKAFRREDKQQAKAGKSHKHEGEERRSTVWLIDFHGDIRASGTDRFAEEISAIIAAAESGDEVVVRLESAGGLVHAYGLAAAELDRLRDAGLATTVCIDKVAASGGYLMACGADSVRAAPLAVVGSIGVVAQVPNVHRLLKRHDIDVEVLTAGRYKRTLTVLGENTNEGREKFIDDLERTHELFKRHVAERRPELDIEAIATGEIWYGSEALDRGLVDALGTSEAYLAERMQEARVIRVKLEPSRRLAERLGAAVSAGVEQTLLRGAQALDASLWQKR